MRNLLYPAGVIGCLLISAGAHAASVADGLKALDDKKFEQAAQAFSQSFNDGDADGGFYLGRMLELGVGSQPNPAAALVMYKAAAQQKSAKALNRLGLMHYRGELGVLQDLAQARTYICEAADLQDKDGSFNCAEMYAAGKGGKQDIAVAVKHYRSAAKQGHVGAQNTLGFLYKAGKGVKKSAERAFAYFEQTGSRGNPIGLFEMGRMYELGRPKGKDLSKAYLYFNLANARRHPNAASALQRTAAQLKPQQLLKAQLDARAWKSKR